MAKDLLFICLLVVVLGLIAGAFGLGAQTQQFMTPQDNWSPRDYTAPSGSCVVPPQGDPLYDEWYAKNVNNPNCDAFIKQARSKNIDADTRQTDFETTQKKVATSGMLFVGGCIVAFFAYAILRR